MVNDYFEGSVKSENFQAYSSQIASNLNIDTSFNQSRNGFSTLFMCQEGNVNVNLR
jgi:hypothetical protein